MKPKGEMGNSVIVIKCGALGDIIRTAYVITALARETDAEITWVTSKQGVDFLRFNPYISKITVLGSEDCPIEASAVISLDDELEAASYASTIRTESVTGAYTNKNGQIVYTGNSSEWFDMGLLSVYGKDRADELKKQNRRTHAQILGDIVGVRETSPVFFGSIVAEKRWSEMVGQVVRVVGLNMFAGRRWPTKEMLYGETIKLIDRMRAELTERGVEARFVVFCDKSNIERAKALGATAGGLEIWDCSAGGLVFAAAIKACDYVVSTDSLGLHLAIAQRIPNLSYYAPTSAAEIDTFDTGVKVVSMSADYCSYRADADNSSLTAERVLAAWCSHIEELEW